MSKDSYFTRQQYKKIQICRTQRLISNDWIYPWQQNCNIRGGVGLTSMRFLSFIGHQYLFMYFQTLFIIYLFLLFFNTKVL